MNPVEMQQVVAPGARLPQLQRVVEVEYRPQL